MFRSAMNNLNYVKKMFIAQAEPHSSSTNNNLDTLTQALIHLYAAEAAAPYEVTIIAYDSAKWPLEPLTLKSRRAEQTALSLLKKLNNQFDVTRARKLLEAHTLLGSGCLTNNDETIKKALHLLHETPLSVDQIKLFMEVRILGNQTDPDFRILGFLGYASRHGYEEIVNLLLSNGANPGSKPLLEDKEENTHDDKPIFFSVATHITTWIDYRTINQKSIKAELVSFDKSMKLIHLYLDQGFDINTTYQNQNVLQHAYNANFSGDMKYHVHLIAHKVAKMFENKVISKQSYVTFCETLHKAGILKLFPILVTSYQKCSDKPIYANEQEANYFKLKSLLFNLIGLCAYEQFRIESDIIATLTYSEKGKKFKTLLSELKSIHSTYCEGNNNPDGNKLASLLKEKKQEIEKIVQISRITLFSPFKTTATIEWGKFLSMNTAELEALNYNFSATDNLRKN